MKEVYDKAANLPADWNNLVGDNFYLQPKFLEFIEQAEKREMTYYLFRDNDGKADSILVSFWLKFNLLMYTKRLNMRINANMFYIPLSISRPGVVLGDKTKAEAVAFIRSLKGYKIVPNLVYEEELEKNFAIGTNGPRCIFNVRFDTFEDYLSSLRSNYRYRFNKALKKSKDFSIRLIQNPAFSDRLYELYLQVFKRSRVRLECLSKEFFQGGFFKILVAECNGEPQGFVQLIENGKELIFEFIGFEHSSNNVYDTYMRLLLEIVKYGIENKFESIDFGQTADDAKLKLGCRYTFVKAYIHHSNRLILAIQKKTVKFFQYKPLDQDKFHIFKAYGDKK